MSDEGSKGVSEQMSCGENFRGHIVHPFLLKQIQVCHHLETRVLKSCCSDKNSHLLRQSVAALASFNWNQALAAQMFSYSGKL